jgi:hypothetical protein
LAHLVTQIEARKPLAGVAVSENPTMSNSSTLAKPSPSAAKGTFPGPERRRHRVYVTRNTEYHFRDGFCVAVRDRRTGHFLRSHLALRRRIQGGLRFYLNGAILPNAGDPEPGEALYFASNGRDLVTSPLESVQRPSKEMVEAYLEPHR